MLVFGIYEQDGNELVRITVTLKLFLEYIFAVGICRYITYSEFVSVALFPQHAECMYHIIFSSVACPAVPNVSTLSYKRYDFRKKNLNMKCLF
jgi:hypothetical protein